MSAIPLILIKQAYENGSILDIKVWRLPATSSERPHGLKYSLFFGWAGERIVGYDNEAGKGDHRHYRTRELPYEFSTLKQMIQDFYDDVAKERGEF